MGGLDWAALDFWVEFVGISDVEGLVNRLMVIRNHKPVEDMKVNQGSTDDEQV